VNTVATGIEVVGIAAFFVAVVYVIWAHSANVRNARIRIAAWQGMQRQPVRARLEAVPDMTSLEPRRVPSPWALEMLRDVMWMDEHLGEHVTRELIRVISHHYTPDAQAIVREIESARRTVKGELAS